jgi:hypothetical protein
MYVGEGTSSDAGRQPRSLLPHDDARAASPVFTDMTTSSNIGYCTGQCWYDNVVYSPPGQPDVVYLGGSYSYGTYGSTTNGRAFIRSADAGRRSRDMTWDRPPIPRRPATAAIRTRSRRTVSIRTRTRSSRSRERTPRSSAVTAV